MKKLTKVKSVGLSKFNNAEFVNFASRFLELIYDAKEGDLPGTGAALGIDPADVTLFEEELVLMGDIVSQSRISDITAKLAELDKERSEFAVHLITQVHSSLVSPKADKKQAAISLSNAMKPYVGCQRLPNQQKTHAIKGLITDMNKPENAANVRALDLNDALEAMEASNTSYALLIKQRSNKLAAAKLEESKGVRQRMADLFDYMSCCAFAQNLLHPTETTATFLRNLNAMIDETTALRNQRIGQLKRQPANVG